MKWINKILASLPKPWKYVQRKLDIEAEWVEFKTNMKPHRYKVSILGLIILYPICSPALTQVQEITKKKLSSHLIKLSQPTEPLFKSTQNLLKHLLQHVFADPKVKDGGLDFLFAILKDQKFMSTLLELLVSALKSPMFMSELKLAVKEIAVEQLRDPEFRKETDDFLLNLSKNEALKKSLISLVQQVFSSKQSEQTLINLLKKGITNQQVKQTLGDSVNFAVREVLSDEETLNQLKIFIFFLLRKFQTDQEIKDMMDILFAKGIGLIKKKKEPELDKFLRPKKSDAV